MSAAENRVGHGPGEPTVTGLESGNGGNRVWLSPDRAEETPAATNSANVFIAISSRSEYTGHGHETG